MTLTIYRTGVAVTIQNEDGSFIAERGVTLNKQEAKVWSRTSGARRYQRLTGCGGRIEFLLVRQDGSRI